MGIDHRSAVGYFGIVLFFILLTLLNGRVVAEKPVISEFALPKEVSSANALALDSLGRVWFAEKVGKNLTMFDPETRSFEVYPLPDSWGSVGPSSIAFSPRGDIWFTVRRWAESVAETNILGKFSISDRSFRRYSLVDQVSPEELVVDDSGVVWFLAPNESRLYRFEPASSVLNGFSIPTIDGYPRGIAIDQKGDIWFAEANANKIGRFVPGTEVFYEYKIPTAFANPGELAVDSDGKIWFLELTANRIGVFYPEWERFDEALIPTFRGMPSAMAVDGDGNLWFLEYQGNKVGAFNPIEATFREYNIPTFGSLPGDLVIDVEKSILWFSETNTESRKLGMLSIEAALLETGKVGNRFAGELSADGGTIKAAYVGFLLLIFSVAMIGILLWYSKKKGTRG